MEIRVFVGNLAEYNSGRLVGEWLTLPMDEEELSAKIGLISGEGHDDWEVMDIDCEFDLKESYMDLHKINEIVTELDSIDEDPAIIRSVIETLGIEYAVRILSDGNYRIYEDCNSMEDVAQAIVEETGILDDVNDIVSRYFDYMSFGRDLELEGTFIRVIDNNRSCYVEILD